MKLMRTATMRCLGAVGTRACTTTSIAWKIGEHCDPAVRIPVEQIKIWIKLWRQAGDTERGHLREAWPEGLKAVMMGGVNWQKR